MEATSAALPECSIPSLVMRIHDRVEVCQALQLTGLKAPAIHPGDEKPFLRGSRVAGSTPPGLSPG